MILNATTAHEPILAVTIVVIVLVDGIAQMDAMVFVPRAVTMIVLAAVQAPASLAMDALGSAQQDVLEDVMVHAQGAGDA